MADNYIERKMAELAEKRRGDANRRRRCQSGLPQGYAAVSIAARRIFLAVGPGDCREAAKPFISAGCRVAIALEPDAALAAEAEKEGFRYCPLQPSGNQLPELSPSRSFTASDPFGFVSEASCGSGTILSSALGPIFTTWRDIDLAVVSAGIFTDAQTISLAQAWLSHRKLRPNVSDYHGLLVLTSESRTRLEGLIARIAPELNAGGINIVGLSPASPGGEQASLPSVLLWLAQLPAARLNAIIL